MVSAVRTMEAGGDEADLINAIHVAQDSEIGPCHDVTLWGKAQLMRLRKLRLRVDLEHAEEHHIREISAASVFSARGALPGLAQAIDTASRELGSAHPVVEAARVVYREHRNKVHRIAYKETVEKHVQGIDDVFEVGDKHDIFARIKTAADELGWGHPAVDHCHRRWREFAKAEESARAEANRCDCAAHLAGLSAAAELALAALAAEVAFEFEGHHGECRLGSLTAIAHRPHLLVANASISRHWAARLG